MVKAIARGHFQRAAITPFVAPKSDGGGRAASLFVPRAESAQEIDNEAYQQNQAKPAAADDGTAKVKPAAAEQEKQNHHE
jgi:hypothetical protein